MSARYREYTPHPALRDHVECFWSRTGRSDEREARVLPDGCVDILFDLTRGGARVVGTMTRPLDVRTEGADDFVAVRFRPGGAFPFLRARVDELTDDAVDLAAFWADGDRLGDRLRSVDGAERRARRLERALLERLDGVAPVDARVRQATDRLPFADVSSVSAEVGVSRQHLTRVFCRQVGVGPKRFARVVRMRRFLDRLETMPAVDWSRAALDGGFYDQPHMIAEMKALTGCAPGFHFSKTRPSSGR